MTTNAVYTVSLIISTAGIIPTNYTSSYYSFLALLYIL